METPYDRYVGEIQEIKAGLIKLMCLEPDLKVFKNIAAVYVVWQHESQDVETERGNWVVKTGANWEHH